MKETEYNFRHDDHLIEPQAQHTMRRRMSLPLYEIMKIMNLKFIIIMIFAGFNVSICLSQNLYPKKKGANYVYVDDNGYKVLKTKFEKAEVFLRGRAAVKIDGSWGYIDTKGEMIIPNIYESASSFTGPVAIVRKGSDFCFIDREGLLGEHKYDSIYPLGNYFVVKNNDAYGFTDSTSKVIEKLKFQDLGTLHNNIITVKIDDHWANWTEGQLNLESPELYFFRPEKFPIYSKKCVNIEDAAERVNCSNRAMLEDIFQSLKYPKEAKDKGVGGIVVIQFVINANGDVIDSKILRDIGAGCGEEGLRVVDNVINKWHSPGMHDNMRVNTVYNLPLKYKLN